MQGDAGLGARPRWLGVSEKASEGGGLQGVEAGYLGPELRSQLWASLGLGDSGACSALEPCPPGSPQLLQLVPFHPSGSQP